MIIDYISVIIYNNNDDNNINNIKMKKINVCGHIIKLINLK